jgi:preprotein translocase subunit SecY
MFRVPDLRNKILFTLFIVFLFRVGSHIPVPYVDFKAIQALSTSSRENPSSGVLGLFDLFSGGALTAVSVFFLGIMPYITASIIMQLLGVVIPKLEEWQNEGQTGQKKITQWTRYLTVALALMQSTAFVFVLKSGNGGLLGQSNFALPENVVLIPNFTSYKAIMIVMTWTAGTALVMWLGELITQRGIGNGMSMLIFTSVVSRLPYQGAIVYKQDKFQFAVLVVVVLLMVLAIVTVESGQRRIPVQFAKRVVGRRMYGGQSTYIPL